MPECWICGTDASVGEVAIWEKQTWLWVQNTIESSSFWQQFQNKEASDIYCRGCWIDWGRHVRSGCKYALSRACEELAVQAGIQFIQNSPHNGNPFYCPPCDRYFNHGAASLEKHLLESHSVALKHRGYSAPVLEVLGCQEDQTISDAIRGKYAAKSWHHGKPLYQKVEGSDKAFIYFWDDRDGDWFHGWWFSSGKVGGHFHAYNCTYLNPEDLTVPMSGWKGPWSGDIHWPLNIEMSQETATFSNDSEIKVQWEFDASDGGEEKWQPMSQAMGDALEKRWAEGWHGDNETDIFYLQSNGFPYSIDCFCMVQLNLRTGRFRDIRRSEVRATASEVLPKLVEKEAQVERLQTEKKCLLEERSNLIAKVNKLEQEKAALANSQADHASQMCLQESWRLNAQLRTDKCIQLNAWDPAFCSIQEALIEACPADHYYQCQRAKNISITGLQQVQNIEIWKEYEFQKQRVRKDLEGRAVPVVSSSLASQVCSWAHLDAKINEVLLIHGTTQDKVDQIATFGFDERRARENGLYGQGVYFTDQSCKSFQYSGAKWQDSGCLIISRVILGHPCEAQGPLRNLKVEPLVDDNSPSKGRCHSVIARPGIPHGSGRQVHREFVLFNGARAYPEMIVYFKTS